MAQPADDEKNAQQQDHVWPTSLLLNQAYAQTFQCTMCVIYYANLLPYQYMNIIFTKVVIKYQNVVWLMKRVM